MSKTYRKTWLTEIKQSDWLAAVYNAVENRDLKTIVSDLNRGLLSIRHLEMFSHSKISETPGFASCL